MGAYRALEVGELPVAICGQRLLNNVDTSLDLVKAIPGVVAGTTLGAGEAWQRSPLHREVVPELAVGDLTGNPFGVPPAIEKVHPHVVLNVSREDRVVGEVHIPDNTVESLADELVTADGHALGACPDGLTLPLSDFPDGHLCGGLRRCDCCEPGVVVVTA